MNGKQENDSSSGGGGPQATVQSPDRRAWPTTSATSRTLCNKEGRHQLRRPWVLAMSTRADCCRRADQSSPARHNSLSAAKGSAKRVKYLHNAAGRRRNAHSPRSVARRPRSPRSAEPDGCALGHLRREAPAARGDAGHPVHNPVQKRCGRTGGQVGAGGLRCG